MNDDIEAEWGELDGMTFDQAVGLAVVAGGASGLLMGVVLTLIAVAIF